jgi:hypothetical protein
MIEVEITPVSVRIEMTTQDAAMLGARLSREARVVDEFKEPRSILVDPEGPESGRFLVVIKPDLTALPQELPQLSLEWPSGSALAPAW